MPASLKLACRAERARGIRPGIHLRELLVGVVLVADQLLRLRQQGGRVDIGEPLWSLGGAFGFRFGGL